jgi:dihydroorotate dehydrogenase (NAD+) catalytic subunit
VSPERSWLEVRRGRLVLANPVLTAAGCAGFATELAAALPLERLGAHVVKSLAPFAHTGNPAPRLAPVPGGMVNSVGLAGPGVAAWRAQAWPRLKERGVPTALSIWGFRPEDYGEALAQLGDIADELVYVELNLSCPNLDASHDLFAHDPVATAAVVAAVRSVTSAVVLVKLSPNTDRILEVAAAALDEGADGFVATNTLIAQWYRGPRPALGAERGGGLSGGALHPVALRCVAELRARFGDVPILGVGGVATLADVLRFVRAGADAVQVGTALFVDPRRPVQLLERLAGEVARRGASSWEDFCRALRSGRSGE